MKRDMRLKNAYQCTIVEIYLSTFYTTIATNLTWLNARHMNIISKHDQEKKLGIFNDMCGS